MDVAYSEEIVYFLSVWTDEEPLRRFLESDELKSFQRKSKGMTEWRRTHTFSSMDMPDWKHAIQKLEKEGSMIVYAETRRPRNLFGILRKRQ